MSKLYISTDLNVNSSGGIVAQKELEAMKEFAKETNEDVLQLSFNDVHPLSYGLPDQPFLIDFLTLEKLSKLDKDNCLSNVNLAHMYGGCYPNTIRYLRSKGIKTTYSCMMHDRKISIEEHEKYFGNYPFSHVKDDRLWPMYIGGAKEADIVITPGNAPKESLLREGAKRVEIIPHGCDIPEHYSITNIPNPFNVGYLGANGPDKGLFYLIKAWSDLNYKDNTLILAGRGTEQLGSFIQKYATGGCFRILGRIENVADFYNSIAIYIQPSATEAFGMETIEAMSYGRTVIVSDGAGSSSCIDDGKDGFVVPSRDPSAMVNKIKFLMNTSNLTGIGQAAREKSLNYSWDKIKGKYIKVWKELLDE